MKKILQKSIASGILISIGSAIYLTLENKIIGAIFFSIGLFFICSYQLDLFTGKIGYVFDNKNNPNVFLIWLGNLVGSILSSTLLRIAKPDLYNKAKLLMSSKIQGNTNVSLFHGLFTNLPSIFILSVFCGILIFLAVDYYKKNSNINGVIGIFLGVIVFILCGFEHSIADMCYCIFAISNIKEFLPFLCFIIIVTLGNSIGSLIMKQFCKQEN